MVRLGIVSIALVAIFLWLRPESPPNAPRELAARATTGTGSAAAPPPARREPAPVTVPRARVAAPETAPAPAPSLVTAPDEHVGWQALRLLGNPLPSRAWDGWRCADIDDGHRRSAWARPDFPDDPPLIHEGTCAEWENQPPGYPG